MDGDMIPIVGMLIPITAILGAFITSAFYRKYDNDERMAMIAKGIAPPQKTSRDVNPSNSLRWGFLLVGVGVGLLMGSLLQNLIDINSDTAHFAMIFIFGGLGLLASYFYQMNLDKKNLGKKEE